MKCGIVDMGSNTIQLSVYQVEGGTFRSLFHQWETVGLAGYVEGGVLSPEGITAACRTLKRFRALLYNLEMEEMYVFATASLRNISNSRQALDAIREGAGLPVALLSGEEEARLSFRGAISGGGPASGILADIGGGSTELVAYENGLARADVSLPIGVMSLFSQFVDGLLPTPTEVADISAHVAALLEGAPSVRAKSLVAVGGTARAVFRLCNALSGADPENRTVSAEEVLSLYSTLKQGDRAALRLILRNVPDRVHTVLPGLVLLGEIIARYGVDTLTLSLTGVREGYLLERVMGGTAG